MGHENQDSNTEVILKEKSGNEQYKIPIDGSLGLLALGYVGLMLWREKRIMHEASTIK